MNIGEVVKGIFMFLFEDSMSTLVKPLFALIQVVTLSPQTLAQMPFIDPLYDIIRGVSGGILILITSWQGLKAMGMGLGLEAEEPQKVAVKAFIAGFLIFYIKEILLIFVTVSSEITSAILSSSSFANNSSGFFQLVLTVLNTGGLYFVLGLILVFKCFGLAWSMFKRLAMCALLLICSPLAAAASVSKTTEGFWQGFIKLFIGNIVIQIVQSLCVVAMFITLGSITQMTPLDLPKNIFYMVLTIAMMSITSKLEDVIKEISMSIGIGRDMQGALGKMQSVAYTASSVQGAIGKFAK